MNKYFPKALIYSEKNNYIQVITILTTVFGLNIVQFIVNQYFNGEANFQNLIDYIFGMFFIIVVSVLAMQFESYNQKEVKYNFLLSQPYKRDAIVITKFLVTILAVLVPVVTYGIIVSAILIINSQGSLMLELWQTILIVSVLSLNLTAIVQLFQHIVGKSIVATFMPLIIAIILPIIIGTLGLLIPGLTKLSSIIDIIAMSIMNLLDNIGLFSGMCVLLLVAAIIVYISVLLNRKINYERTSELFLFKGVEIFAQWIVSFFIGSLIVIAIVIGLKVGLNIDLTKGVPLLIVDMFVVGITIGLYKLSNYIKGRMA